MYPYPVPPRQENFFVTLVKTWAKASVIAVTVGVVLFLGFIASFVAFFAMIGGLLGGVAVPSTIEVGDSTATFVAGREDSENILLNVPLSGLILGQNDGSEGFFGGEVTYGYDLKQILEDAAELEDVKGVVIDTTSGGGTIYGSVAISDGVERYRDESGDPIITFVEGIAASGAYWVASSTDEILVDHGSSVGSIGVIYGPFQFFDRPVAFDGGLLGGGIVTQNGISVTYFTAGRGKDMGNPFRPLTPEEIQIAQVGVDNSYSEFVTHVAATREIPEETIRTKIGAYVYDNKTATDLGLMDATANRDEAYDRLAELAEIPGDDWAVYQIDRPVGGFPFFAKAFGSADEGDPEPECRLYREYLAYFGDVSALCLRPE